jgi:hypothetical protein
MFCEIINCGLYAYLLSNILDILLNKDTSNSYKFRANQLNLENWIMHYMKKLPSSSKKDNLHRNKIWEETKKYFELYYNPTKNFKWIQEKDFIKQMKPSQRNELLLNSFNNIFTKFNSFFKRIYLNSSKIKIVMNFKTSIQVSKTEITNNWKNIHKIYFIDKGMINICRNREVFFTLTEGFFFGIESILLDDNNKKDVISYKVSDDCPYVILYTIDIPFLFKEILNYDSESFIGIINWSNFYIENILNAQNFDLFNKERVDSLNEVRRSNNNSKSNIRIKSENNIIVNKNLIDTSEKEDNINKTSIDNKIKLGEDMIKTRKLNMDLIQPGSIPELENKLAEYRRAQNVINESNLKIDLINKQINFINKYMAIK